LGRIQTAAPNFDAKKKQLLIKDMGIGFDFSWPIQGKDQEEGTKPAICLIP
jgi:hypothetical protein